MIFWDSGKARIANGPGTHCELDYHGLEGHERTRNKYALAAIRERRAEMAGEITSLESRLRNLRQSLVHVHATLRLFDPDAKPPKIPGKRPYKRVKLFGAGKLNWLILGALRRGGAPRTTREVVAAIVAELNYGPEGAKGMTNRVRANLRHLRDTRGLVTKEGDRAEARWALATS